MKKNAYVARIKEGNNVKIIGDKVGAAKRHNDKARLYRACVMRQAAAANRPARRRRVRKSGASAGDVKW